MHVCVQAMDATYMERERSGKPRAGRKRGRGDDFIYDDKAGYGPGRGRGGRGRGDGEERSTVGRCERFFFFFPSTLIFKDNLR